MTMKSHEGDVTLSAPADRAAVGSMSPLGN
jgi:hypothetical protein